MSLQRPQLQELDCLRAKLRPSFMSCHASYTHSCSSMGCIYSSAGLHRYLQNHSQPLMVVDSLTRSLETIGLQTTALWRSSGYVRYTYTNDLCLQPPYQACRVHAPGESLVSAHVPRLLARAPLITSRVSQSPLSHRSSLAVEYKHAAYMPAILNAIARALRVSTIPPESIYPRWKMLFWLSLDRSNG